MYEELVKKILICIILMIIICTGILGNVINIIVFGRKSMRQMSTFR